MIADKGGLRDQPRVVALAWTALALLSAIPIIISPLVMMPDLFVHIGRFHVMLDGGENAFLRHYFAFEWRLAGNLGVDLMMLALGPLFGVELGARLAVAIIAPLGVLGIYRVSRAVHGRIVPGAYPSLVLIFCFPFLYGFVNFALGSALALIAISFWITIPEAKPWLKPCIGAMMSVIIWLVHMTAWGEFLVIAGSFALVSGYRRYGRSLRTILAAAGQCAPLMLPLILTVLWRTQPGGGGLGARGYSLALKAKWIGMILRSENEIFDVATIIVVLLVMCGLLFRCRKYLNAPLLISGGIIAALFWIMPPFLFGSYYADMRLLPMAFTLLLLSVSHVPARPGMCIAILGISLFTVRIGLQSWGWHQRGTAMVQDLRAIDAMAPGARVAVIAARSFCDNWVVTSYETAPSLAIARKNAFVNSEWDEPGHNLLTPLNARDVGFHAQPSSLWKPPGSHCQGRSMADILAHLPQDRFDYVWIFAPEAGEPGVNWLTPQFKGPHSRLYRIREADEVQPRQRQSLPGAGQ